MHCQKDNLQQIRYKVWPTTMVRTSVIPIFTPPLHCHLSSPPILLGLIGNVSAISNSLSGVKQLQTELMVERGCLSLLRPRPPHRVTELCVFWRGTMSAAGVVAETSLLGWPAQTWGFVLAVLKHLTVGRGQVLERMLSGFDFRVLAGSNGSRLAKLHMSWRNCETHWLRNRGVCISGLF